MRSSAWASRISTGRASSSTVTAAGISSSGISGHRCEPRRRSRLASRRAYGITDLARGVVEPDDHALGADGLAHGLAQAADPIAGLLPRCS